MLDAAAADEEVAAEDDCATAPWLKTRAELATKHTNRIKQRNKRRAIPAAIIAAELLRVRKFRKTFMNPRWLAGSDGTLGRGVAYLVSVLEPGDDYESATIYFWRRGGSFCVAGPSGSGNGDGADSFRSGDTAGRAGQERFGRE